MCRSKNDPCGARRCPTRTAVSTAEALSAEYSQQVASTLTPANSMLVEADTVAVAELKQKVEALKVRIAAGGEGSLSFDSEIEVEIQQVGADFVAAVDEVVEFSEDDMYDALDVELSKIFEAPDELEEAKHRLSTVVENSKEHDELTARVALLEDMVENEDEYVKRAEQEIYDRVAESYRQGYLEVLSQIRPVGLSHASVIIDGEHPGLEEQISRTVFSHYPTEWLQRHVEAGDMYVGSDSTAVHYNGYAPDSRGERLERVQNFKTITTSDEEGRAFLKENVLKHYNIVADGSREMSAGETLLLVYGLPEEELGGYDETVKPDGEGWQFRTSMTHVLSEEHTSEESFIKAATTERWVRDVSKEEPVISKLNFYSSKEAEALGEEHTSAVLYHEFGHRMEHVLPDNVLPRMEKAFLLRRSGKTEETQHEGMIKNVITSEFYHRADFVDHYVGRDYFTGESYEVFSTGVEALLGKKFSGLIGLDANSPRRDEDHRRFTLGVLATL